MSMALSTNTRQRSAWSVELPRDTVALDLQLMNKFSSSGVDKSICRRCFIKVGLYVLSCGVVEKMGVENIILKRAGV